MIYEECYGPAMKRFAATAVCGLLAAFALLPEMPLLVRAFAVALFGGGAVLFLVGMFTRRVALRIDAKGITLGGIPLRYRATTVFLPWSSVEAVAVWRQKQPRQQQTMQWVGVAHRPGSPSPQELREFRQSVIARLVPHVPNGVVASSRAADGWSLDPERLRTAVRTLAPHVEFVDAG